MDNSEQFISYSTIFIINTRWPNHTIYWVFLCICWNPIPIRKHLPNPAREPDMVLFSKCLVLFLSVPAYSIGHFLIWRGCVQIVNKRKVLTLHHAKVQCVFIVWGTVTHWLQHWTHDHKVVGTSPDSSSLCSVPKQDS